MRSKLKTPSYLSILFTLMGVLHAQSAYAVPSHSGSTGLVSVPTAETLDAGNISVGIWGNLLEKDRAKSFVLPATLTLGMGSFIEVYGAYPNLLFNQEEDESDRNSADFGMKVRLYGKRAANLKIAADAQYQRRISHNPAIDGATDFGGRMILTYKTDLFGVHAYGGYMTRELTDDEYLYGGALEFSLTPRLKLFTEVTGKRYKEDIALEGPLEGDVGLHYFLTPYLSFTAAGGQGFSDASPDWRFIFGFSTSTGLGYYIKPVPKLESELKAEAAKLVVIKPVKIVPISTKLVKAPAAPEAVSKVEVPVDPDKEEVVIRTYGQIILPPQNNETARPFIPPPPPDAAAEAGQSSPAPVDSRRDDQPPTYGFDITGEAKETASTPLPKPDEKLIAYRKFRFPDVVGYFQQGQAELTPDAKKLLADLADQIRTDKGWSYLRIDAYTDSIGSQRYNFDLSLRRAIEVASHLITREGIDSNRIFVRGMGSTKQLADNQSEAGRKMNRRFEILFLQREDQQ